MPVLEDRAVHAVDDLDYLFNNFDTGVLHENKSHVVA